MIRVAQKNILVVEDNGEINRLFCKHLRSFNYICVGVASVSAAIDYVDTNPIPDLIVLDLELGDAHGTRLLDHLHENGMLQPHIIIASANVNNSPVPLQTYNPTDIMEKPISPRQLVYKINAVLAE